MPTISTSAAGPLARRAVKSLARAHGRKLDELAPPRASRAAMERICRQVDPDNVARAGGPAFEAYTDVTNWVSTLLESLSDLPELRRLVARIAKAEDDYMPSGPPMSPLTPSFFWSWAYWDVSEGAERETLGSIFLAIARARGLDGRFAGVLDRLVNSRLGLHVHEGLEAATGRIRLRELVTDELRSCANPSGHRGSPGELWLARVLPPPHEEIEESVVVTTPYLVLSPSVEDWRAYLRRTLPAVDPAGNEAAAYRALMKRGLGPTYWSEYVFEAYVNHRPDVILLTGIPDVAESRPHSRANAHKW